ncbi:MAG: NAD(P)/FAD-dependent oxidoreductase [Candidatus Ratteibacteria bacterium]
MKVYELIIIGAGPAGLTAGIYAARKNMDFIIITKDIGGMTNYSWDIENYLGYQFITGPELVEKFKEHIKEFNVDIKEGQEVIRVLKEEENFKILTNSENYLSKTVIIATGRRPKELNVKGENQFRNKGITYCATCDAPLFRNKVVAVVGGGNSGLDAVLQLSRIAKKIYLIEINKNLTGDQVVVNKVKNIDKVEIFTDAKLLQIYGDKFVEGIRIGKNNEILEFKVDGIFVEIGSVPNSEIIDFIDKNEKGEIIVDCKNKTSQRGIFSAGDVTNVFAKQIIVACGEGAKAAISSFEYLKYL